MAYGYKTNNSLSKVENQVSESGKKQTFSTWLQNTGSVLINRTYTDQKQASRFQANLMSLISTNPQLTECTYPSILSCAMQADSYGLSIFPQLGQTYCVPFQKKEYNPETKKREVVSTTGTFIMGYKGYIQLALRSGQYRKINVIPIKDGEFQGWDRFNEEIVFGTAKSVVTDFSKLASAKTVGYYAMFETINGFKKAMYMSIEEMQQYANKYSSAFNLDDYNKLIEGKVSEKDMWKFSSYWYTSFDSMACKTMIRKLLSTWGIMSIELQNAFINDSNSMALTGDYVEGEAQILNFTEKMDSRGNNGLNTDSLRSESVKNDTNVVDDAISKALDEDKMTQYDEADIDELFKG